jgi:C4-dicarboxylate-binding protein DctP
MLITVPAWFSSFVHQMDVFSLPFLVASLPRLRAALEGPLGQRMAGYCAAAGFQMLGWWITGPRHMLNNVRPIHTPADMAGIKLRVIASQVYIETFRRLGANPVAMDTSECYLGLQQHAIDGLENPVTDIVIGKYYEVTKYLSTTGHVVDFFVAAMNKGLWDGLSPAEQEMARQAMKKADDWQWTEQPKQLDAAMEKLRTLVQVNDTTPEERAAFVTATRPVYQQFEASIGKDVIEQAIRELA